MAILRGVPKLKRGASLRGRVMIDTFRGALRVRKWPKKRGPPKSELQAFWVDWFVQANRLAKYADGLAQARAIQMTKGSGLYPRDVHLMAMRGRLYTWSTPDGWRWYSMAAIGDISESLDVLAQTVGDILVRATDRWRPPPAGNPGDVLTNAGPGSPPGWAAPSAGGGFIGGALVKKTGNQTINNNAWTTLVWPSEAYDTDDLHDDVTNNSRLTADTGRLWVRLTAGVKWDNNSAGQRRLRIIKNGSAVFDGHPSTRYVASTQSDIVLTSPVLAVVADDYFEAQVYQSSGVNRTVDAVSSTWFAMELL